MRGQPNGFARFGRFFWPVRWPRGSQRADLPQGMRINSFARHPQVGQSHERGQLRGVLRQPTVAYLDVAKLALEHPKRVFHLGADGGLGLLQAIEQVTHRRGLVQRPSLARFHGHMPSGADVLGVLAFEGKECLCDGVECDGSHLACWLVSISKL